MTKRGVDIVLSGVLLILTLPISALQGLIVITTLGRPILFHQARAGRDGVPFLLTKFRSMRPQPTGRPPLSDGDRVTPFGSLMRRLRLDELPQLWLIFTGKMAFVGPRPLYPNGAQPENQALFEERHRVRPGLTGWAQVNGNTLLSEVEKLSLDVYYVHHVSFRADLKIWGLTAITILQGERRNECNIRKAVEYAHRISRRG